MPTLSTTDLMYLARTSVGRALHSCKTTRLITEQTDKAAVVFGSLALPHKAA